MYTLIILLFVATGQKNIVDTYEQASSSSVPGFQTLDLCEEAASKVRRNSIEGRVRANVFCVKTR
jgi:hypothetical protein